ncbi:MULTISPECIES: WhiB family transcriptional regulator [unclassified Streptomyces]|uniref:WhiB family transcriptional regulator n=1 Tax=unclassified Streptomyces TaxID=2593676 RepID=UPI002DD95DD0|nr:WhiB family transcriptional regulator [Streptomyces sp. NBC_00243]WRZ17936.1 WhiB family transcriptional regulator [Streptomyces sp. NBC_00243]
MSVSPLVPLLDAWQWQADAACRGMASAVFFSPTGERGHRRRRREQRAVEVCRTCPVLDDCAAFALSTRQPYGIWGGLTEHQRDIPLPASRAA